MSPRDWAHHYERNPGRDDERSPWQLDFERVFWTNVARGLIKRAGTMGAFELSDSVGAGYTVEEGTLDDETWQERFGETGLLSALLPGISDLDAVNTLGLPGLVRQDFLILPWTNTMGVQALAGAPLEAGKKVTGPSQLFNPFTSGQLNVNGQALEVGYGQSFTPPAGTTVLTGVSLNLAVEGSPTDNYTFSIQTDSGSSSPSGTALVSLVVNAANLVTGLNAIALPALAVTPGTTYWLCIVRTSGSTDGANFIAWRRGAANAAVPWAGFDPNSTPAWFTQPPTGSGSYALVFGGQMPADVSSAVATTALLAFEANKGIAQTVLAPYSAVKKLAVTALAPFEALQKLAQTILVPFEATAGVATTSVSQTAQLVFEAAQGIAATALAPFSALKKLAVTALDALEATQRIAGVGSADSIEANRGVTAVGTQDPYEATKGVTATGLDPVEATRSLAVAGSSDPLDATKALAVTALDPVETLKKLAVSGALSPVEALTGITALLVEIYEATKGITASGVDPIESNQRLVATGQTTTEALHSISQSASDAYEALLGVKATDAVPFEALQRIRATLGDPLDTEAAAGVITQTASLPFETLAVLRVPVTTVAESLRPISQTLAIPFGALKAITASALDPFEAAKAISALVILPSETTKALSQNTIDSYEALRKIASSSSLPFEATSITITPVSASAVMPLDVTKSLAVALTEQAESTKHVSATSQAVAEALVAIKAAGSASALEALRGIRAQVLNPVEAAALLRVLGSSTAESVTNVTAAVVLPAEALQSVGNAVLVPFEFFVAFAEGRVVLVDAAVARAAMANEVLAAVVFTNEATASAVLTDGDS